MDFVSYLTYSGQISLHIMNEEDTFLLIFNCC